MLLNSLAKGSVIFVIRTVGVIGTIGVVVPLNDERVAGEGIRVGW